MRFLLPLALLVSLLTGGEYLSTESFWQENPEQESRMKAHADRVSKPATLVDGTIDRRIHIAVVHPSKQVVGFWDRAVRTIEGRLREAGLEPEFTIFSSRRSEYHLQTTQLQQAYELNPDYLIFHLESARHRAAVEHLLLQPGGPEIILQNITTPVASWQKQPLIYSGFDHELGSRLLAEGYLELLGDEGRYAVIYGPQGYVSRMRGNAFIDHISALSNWEVVEAYYTDNEIKTAQAVTGRILDAHPEIAFIYACSTDVALGAAEVIDARGLSGQVRVNGWGGGSAEVAALKAGRLDLTVMRMNDDHGVAIAEAIMLDRMGKRDQVPLVFSGEFELLLKGVDPRMLDQLEERAYRYSGR
jgi:autoinducer 2-binding protein LuxP